MRFISLKIRNPKSEIRNPKQSSKPELSKRTHRRCRSHFGFSSFGFVLTFGIRFSSFLSKYFRCERHDFHKVALAQFACDRTENTGAARIQILIDNHDGVVIEAQ